MLAAVSKTPGGCAGRVGDGAVALLPADTGRVLVVGEMGPTCSVDTALHGGHHRDHRLVMRSPDHDNTPSTHRTSVHHQFINSANSSYVQFTYVVSGHSGQGHAAEVTLVVVAVDGALRAGVPLQAAVRGPPPGVALYLADEDVPVLGEGGAGPGEGQRVARVLGK